MQEIGEKNAEPGHFERAGLYQVFVFKGTGLIHGLADDIVHIMVIDNHRNKQNNETHTDILHQQSIVFRDL